MRRNKASGWTLPRQIPCSPTPWNWTWALCSRASPDPSVRRRSEEHTSELQSLMRISYAVFCLKKKNTKHHTHERENINTNNHLLQTQIHHITIYIVKSDMYNTQHIRRILKEIH